MRFLTAIICLVIALNCAAQVNGLSLAKSVGSPLARIAASRQLATATVAVKSIQKVTYPSSLIAAMQAARRQTITRTTSRPNTSLKPSSRMFSPDDLVTTSGNGSAHILAPTRYCAAKSSSYGLPSGCLHRCYKR